MSLDEALEEIEKYVGLLGLEDKAMEQPPTFRQRMAIRKVAYMAQILRAKILRATDIFEEGED